MTMKSLIIAILTGAVISSTAMADINPSSNGGRTCKNTSKHPGSCVLLQTECTGTYEEWVGPDGATMGHCSAAKKQKTPKLKAS
jgi:hypothetical protein